MKLPKKNLKTTGNDNFVKVITEKVSFWQIQAGKKIIVGLDGTSGIGKSTIAKQISLNNPNITVVHLDQFAFPLKQRFKKLKNTQDKPSIYQNGWYNIRKFKKIIGIKYNLKNQVLLVDGVFLQNNDIFSDIFDKHIFITTDQKVITVRRKRRFNLKYPNRNKDGNKIMSLIFDVAWKRYVEKYQPEKNADFIINM